METSGLGEKKPVHPEGVTKGRADSKRNDGSDLSLVKLTGSSRHSWSESELPLFLLRELSAIVARIIPAHLLNGASHVGAETVICVKVTGIDAG